MLCHNRAFKYCVGGVLIASVAILVYAASTRIYEENDADQRNEFILTTNPMKPRKNRSKKRKSKKESTESTNTKQGNPSLNIKASKSVSFIDDKQPKQSQLETPSILNASSMDDAKLDTALTDLTLKDSASNQLRTPLPWPPEEDQQIPKGSVNYFDKNMPIPNTPSWMELVTKSKAIDNE